MKKKTWQNVFMISLISLVLFLPSGMLLGSQQIPTGASIVRIALNTSGATNEIKTEQGRYAIVDMMTQFSFEIEGQNQLTYSPVGALNIQTQISGETKREFSGSLILMKELESTQHGLLRYQGKVYRGNMLIQNINGKLNVINILDVDDYLLGVLPVEMGMANTPLEALKAQAIVSRTYALKQKKSSAIYDLLDNTSSQVYGGYLAERSHTTAAVEATRKQVLYYNNELIHAYFSSNAGGNTESSQNIWNAALPYAQAVSSPFDDAALGFTQDASGWPGSCYKWSHELSLDELNKKLATWNLNNPTQGMQIGEIKEIKAYALQFDQSGRITNLANPSGRITRLDIVGTAGMRTLTKDQVRSFLGLRSTLFKLTPRGGTLVRNGSGVVSTMTQSITESHGIGAYAQPLGIASVDETYHIITADGLKAVGKDAPSQITGYSIEGFGNGHGVGMSQWGAIGMAQAGHTAQDILNHYYNQGKTDGVLAIGLIQ